MAVKEKRSPIRRRVRSAPLSGPGTEVRGRPQHDQAGDNGSDTPEDAHGSTIEVDIDIKPGNQPNSINLGPLGDGPVAILSTPDFDASSVQPDTITLFRRSRFRPSHSYRCVRRRARNAATTATARSRIPHTSGGRLQAAGASGSTMAATGPARHTAAAIITKPSRTSDRMLVELQRNGRTADEAEPGGFHPQQPGERAHFLEPREPLHVVDALHVVVPRADDLLLVLGVAAWRDS